MGSTNRSVRGRAVRRDRYSWERGVVSDAGGVFEDDASTSASEDVSVIVDTGIVLCMFYGYVQP